MSGISRGSETQQIQNIKADFDELVELMQSKNMLVVGELSLSLQANLMRRSVERAAKESEINNGQ